MAERWEAGGRRPSPGTGHVEGKGGSGGADADFEEFFLGVWRRAASVGVRCGLDAQEAEDVALDGLAVTYDRWHRVRDLPYREAWALRVTTNLALRRVRRRPVELRDDWSGGAATVPPDDGVADRLALGAALAGLPKRQREVVVLRYLLDLPEAEVARALGINPGSVKRHASRGRAALPAGLSVPVEGSDRAF